MPKSKAELEALIPKIAYELNTLAGAKQLLLLVGDGSVLSNLVVGAALLHVRNLVQFFFLRGGDVSAKDYLGDSWVEVRPDGATMLGESPRKLYGELSDKLSHISTRRGDKRAWDIPRFADALIGTARIWAQKLLHAQRDVLLSHAPVIANQ